MVEREAGLAAEGKAASQVSCLPLRCCCCRRRHRSRHPHPSQTRCGCCASRVALAQRRGEEGREKAAAAVCVGGWGGMPGAPCSRGRKITPQGLLKPAAEREGRKSSPGSAATYRRRGPGWAEEVYAPHCVSSNLCERGYSRFPQNPPLPAGSPILFPRGATGSLFPLLPQLDATREKRGDKDGAAAGFNSRAVPGERLELVREAVAVR